MSVVEKFYHDFSSFKVDIKNWEILDQGITVLWGPSGAGKSTILNGLLGFADKAEIRWTFRGRSMEELNPSERLLGAVFQEASLFPHMTAEKNILFPVNKVRHPHWEKDFQFLCAELKIGSILNSPARQLSGGEKQRVAIARALIYRPQMLLLDEPFSSLDEAIRVEVRQMLRTLCQEYSCPVLLVTHDPEDVYSLADKVSHIRQGKIIKESTIEEFRASREKRFSP